MYQQRKTNNNTLNQICLQTTIIGLGSFTILPRFECVALLTMKITYYALLSVPLGYTPSAQFARGGLSSLPKHRTGNTCISLLSPKGLTFKPLLQSFAVLLHLEICRKYEVQILVKSFALLWRLVCFGVRLVSFCLAFVHTESVDLLR